LHWLWRALSPLIACDCVNEGECCYRAAVFWIVGMVARFKYYFAWTVSEAGLIFSGFCFNGFSEAGTARCNLPLATFLWLQENR